MEVFSWEWDACVSHPCAEREWDATSKIWRAGAENGRAMEGAVKRNLLMCALVIMIND